VPPQPGPDRPRPGRPVEGAQRAGDSGQARPARRGDHGGGGAAAQSPAAGEPEPETPAGPSPSPGQAGYPQMHAIRTRKEHFRCMQIRTRGFRVTDGVPGKRPGPVAGCVAARPGRKRPGPVAGCAPTPIPRPASSTSRWSRRRARAPTRMDGGGAAGRCRALGARAAADAGPDWWLRRGTARRRAGRTSGAGAPARRLSTGSQGPGHRGERGAAAGGTQMAGPGHLLTTQADL
jgi:hypothetical protein